MALPRNRFRAKVALFALLSTFVVLFRPTVGRLRAVSLLMRFSEAKVASGVWAVGTRPFVEDDGELVAPSGPVRVRRYVPEGMPDAPGLVILHGVHRLGIDEPRLIRFARSLAGAGLRVLTPELRELADYRVDPVS